MSKEPWIYKIDQSALWTFIGIAVLFSTAVAVTLIAPSYIDKVWVEPTSSYQVQMYEVADPNLYISGLSSRSQELQAVHHLKNKYSLLSFQETDVVKMVAPQELEKYITKPEDPTLKLTSRLLLLREPVGPAIEQADALQQSLQQSWAEDHPNWEDQGLVKPAYEILELYSPDQEEAFSIALTEKILEDWIDEDYTILDAGDADYHNDPGVIYVNNPREYRVTFDRIGNEILWHYDPDGKPIQTLEELKSHPLGFRSRKELIHLGEHIFAIEGCWYCHTDQTRTLIQDTVVNGSESYPAPPSSPNEYIYQKITFPGTRRIGPDLSRVGVKRPSRDWHKSHFWSPKTASIGSIMPAFQHFFDEDPRGTDPKSVGIPNYKFEAVFQYLMTKGTRITAPNHAWWLGKDPVQTKAIIEGKKK